MLVVDYKVSFKVLNRYVQAYNQDREKVAERLKASYVLTAKEIIRIYGAFLVNQKNRGELDLDVIPGLKTNNGQLAKLTHSCRRTIQRHILRLMDAGIITRKESYNKGKGSYIILWINEDILLTKRLQSVEQARQELKEALDSHLKRDCKSRVSKNPATNLPRSYTGYNSYINNRIIGVDKLRISAREAKVSDQEKEEGKRCSLSLTKVDDLTGNALTGCTGDQGYEISVAPGSNGNNRGDFSKKTGALKHPAPLPENPGKTGDQAAQRAEGPEDEVNVMDGNSARRKSLSLYVRLLWVTIQHVLYKDIYLTEWQHHEAQRLLLQWYEPVQDAHLQKVHDQYTERVMLVKKYVDKDPKNRFIQLPHQYFDTENPYGFRGTKKWHMLQKRRNRETQQKLIFHAQIRKYFNNLKKDTDQRKPPVQVMSECARRIRELGNPLLVEQFFAKVLASTSYQQHQYN